MSVQRRTASVGLLFIIRLARLITSLYPSHMGSLVANCYEEETFMKKCIISFLIIIVPCIVSAQSKVGTAVVNGSIVDLFSDNTWRFRDEEPRECEKIKLGVSFCDESAIWTRLDNEGPEISAMYNYDDRNYAMFIIEAMGSDDGVNLELMRKIAIENFADGAEISANNVTIFDTYDRKLLSRQATTVEYGGKISGMSLIFYNTIVVEDQRTIQLATYAIGQAPTEQARSLHESFLKNVRISAN